MKKYFLFLFFFSYMGFAQRDSLIITPPRRYPPSCDCFQGMINLTPRLAYTYADAKSSHFAGLMLHNDCIACGGASMQEFILRVEILIE